MQSKSKAEMRLHVPILPLCSFTYLAQWFKIFGLPVPALSLLVQPPINKATLKPNASPICELDIGAQDVHLGVGFGIKFLIFNSPLSRRLQWSVRWCLLHLLLPHCQLISWKERKLAVAPVETCRLQYCVSSQHCCDGCTAGGLHLRPLVEQCRELSWRSGTGSFVLKHASKIAPLVSECISEKRCLTICQLAWWYKLEHRQDTSRLLLPTVANGYQLPLAWIQA
jgi:hypothetical protein